jgi:hypothetical protein
MMMLIDHQVLEEPADHEADLGVTQALGRQRALQDDLVGAPVVEVEQAHADQADPAMPMKCPAEMLVAMVEMAIDGHFRDRELTPA